MLPRGFFLMPFAVSRTHPRAGTRPGPYLLQLLLNLLPHVAMEREFELAERTYELRPLFERVNRMFRLATADRTSKRQGFLMIDAIQGWPSLTFPAHRRVGRP